MTRFCAYNSKNDSLNVSEVKFGKVFLGAYKIIRMGELFLEFVYFKQLSDNQHSNMRPLTINAKKHFCEPLLTLT